MASTIRKFRNTVGLLIIKVGRRICRTQMEARVFPWNKANGDKTLRLDYDLAQTSVVFDLGGYEGQWASDIFARYCCTVHIFELVETFAIEISNRFKHNPSILVHPFGIGNANENVNISMSADGSSAHTISSETIIPCRIVKATDFFQEANISHIDLMKINIEGAEYDLLDHLIESGWINQIVNIQVQFHDFVPNAEVRMAAIQEKLKQTHHITYQFPFVWENWTVNSVKQ